MISIGSVVVINVKMLMAVKSFHMYIELIMPSSRC